MHLDARFLQDVVALSLATAVGGLVAALVHAPHTLGYMVGGVVVGPSGLDLVRNLEQTETVAQFGSIFLLFSHGLMYSHYLDQKKRRVRRKSTPSSPKASPLKKRQTSFQMSYHSSESEDGDDDEAPRERKSDHILQEARVQVQFGGVDAAPRLDELARPTALAKRLPQQMRF